MNKNWLQEHSLIVDLMTEANQSFVRNHFNAVENLIDHLNAMLELERERMSDERHSA